MVGLDLRGDGVRVCGEGQAPLPQERDGERNEQDGADSAGQQGLVPPAEHHLGHGRHVGSGARGQEQHKHRLHQRDGGQHQQCEGGQKRSDGNPAAVTHVTHVTNHP